MHTRDHTLSRSDPRADAPPETRRAPADSGGAAAGEPLRILIVSTPKSGNTWLKLLLGEIYELPAVELPDHPRDIRLEALPSSWIAQQHYWFERPTKEWLEAHGVIVLTTVRHPADVFVSLWHHVQREDRAAVADPRNSFSLKRDAGAMGPAAEAFAREGFYRDLHISISWLRAGESLCVRYEDLWSQPFATLRHVTDFVRSCSDLAIRRAISLCQIRRLQRVNLDRGRGFFRKGGVGGWRDALPPSIAATLREAEPYPAQFGFLGYSMDERQYPAAEIPPDHSADPFRGADRLANGVPVVPALLRAYFAHVGSVGRDWGDPLAVHAGSFFEWLVAPARRDPRPDTVPVVTELAAYLHGVRPDVQAVFPDPFGADRLSFTNWFTANATAEYLLDHQLALPVFRSWAAPADNAHA